MAESDAGFEMVDGDDLSDLLEDYEEFPPDPDLPPAPDVIFLQWAGNDDDSTWCMGKIHEDDAEYIRTDLLRDAFDLVSLRDAYNSARARPRANQAGIAKVREMLYG